MFQSYHCHHQEGLKTTEYNNSKAETCMRHAESDKRLFVVNCALFVLNAV
jgi:hypothetical protein